MSTPRKAAIAVGILAVVILTVPSTVAGFSVPSDWQYDDSDDDDYSIAGSVDQVEDVYIEDREDSVLFGVDIEGGSQTGLDGDTLQVYIDTDEGETGRQSGGSFYAGLDPISADYRVSKTDGGLPILQEYNGEEERYEFVEGIEYKEKNDIAVVKVDKELIDNPESFDVKFAHVYGDVSDSSNYDWLPNSDTETFRVDSEGIGTNTRKSATINVKPTFSEPLDDATVDITLKDDNEEVVDEKTKTGVSSDTITATFDDVNPDNFNNDGASAEVVVEGDEQFAIDEEIDNTAEVPSLSDGDDKTIDSTDGLEFSYIESVVRIRDEDELDSVAFTLTDDDPDNEDRSRDANTDTTNRNEDSDTKSIIETFTVNSNNFDDGDGTLSVKIEGNRPFPDQSKDVKDIDTAPDIDFELSNVPHEFKLEKETPINHPLDIGGSDPDDGFGIDVSLESDSDGSDIDDVTHVIEFDERIDEEEVSIDFYEPYDNGNTYDTTNTEVEDGKVKIKIYSIDSSGEIVTSGNTEKIANIKFKFEDVNNLQENIDYGSDNSESLTLNTVNQQSELIDVDDNQVSYSATDADVEVQNLETRLTGAEVTHRTEYGNMVGSPLKIDVKVETNDGKLDKIELLDSQGDSIDDSGSNEDTDIDCGDKSTCEKMLKYKPDNPTKMTGGEYGAKGHKIEVTTTDSGGYDKTVTLSEKFETIDDNDLDTAIYAKGDVNRDGPSKSKIVRRADVNTVIDNRGEEAGGLPWDKPELARSDLNNDGQIDINDVTSVITEYHPAEGSISFANDPLDVSVGGSSGTVDIDIGQGTSLNNTIDEDVDAVIVNNDGDETKDITTGGNADLTGGTDQPVDIDTTNVDPGDELEVQIHEVSDPDPDDAGGNPIDTATKEVPIRFSSATVESGTPGEIVVSFDADVKVNGTVSDASTAFTFNPDESPLTNSPVEVDNTALTANNGKIIVPLDNDIASADTDTLSNALTYDGTNDDVVAADDGTPAEGFSNKDVTNNI